MQLSWDLRNKLSECQVPHQAGSALQVMLGLCKRKRTRCQPENTCCTTNAMIFFQPYLAIPSHNQIARDPKRKRSNKKGMLVITNTNVRGQGRATAHYT